MDMCELQFPCLHTSSAEDISNYIVKLGSLYGWPFIKLWFFFF